MCAESPPRRAASRPFRSVIRLYGVYGMKKLRKKSILRIVCSLGAVFLLPIIILYFLYAGRIMRAIEDEVGKITFNDLTYSIQIVDSQIKGLDSVTSAFQRGSGYQSYLNGRFSYNDDGVSANALLESDIGYIYQTNPIIGDFFVAFPEADSVLSVSGLHRTGTYLEKYYSGGRHSPEELRNILSGQERNCVFSENDLWSRRGNGDYLIFVYPLSKSIHYNRGIAVISVPTSSLTMFFEAGANDFQTSIFVFDGTDFLFSYNDKNRLASFVEGSLREGMLPLGKTAVSEQGERYIVLRQASDYNGWTYVALLPVNNSLYQSVFNISQFYRIYMLLTLVFGLFAIAVFSWINYRPILRLHKKVSGPEMASVTAENYNDDLEAISAVISSLKQENSVLEATISRNMPEIRAMRLHRLLNNYYFSADEFNADCEQIGLFFEYDNFFVSIFLFEKELPDAEQVAGLILKELTFPGTTEALCQGLQKQIVMIHSVRPGETVHLESFYSALGAIHDQLGETATIGIGHSGKTAFEISKSYTQATAALDSRFSRGSGIVITYDDALEDYNDPRPYPRKLLSCLENALSVDNAEEFGEALGNLLAFVDDGQTSLVAARCICFDIIKTLMGSSAVTQEANTLFLEAFGRLNQMKSKTGMVGLVRDTVENLSKRNDKYDDTGDALLQDILDYMAANYHRCDFSIQEVSSHFEMMPTKIGNYFKARMGCTLLDFLIDQRIILAKDLLRSTDLSVKEISLQSGYYNVSSFIRRFKLHEGITPNEYRFKTD